MTGFDMVERNVSGGRKERQMKEGGVWNDEAKDKEAKRLVFMIYLPEGMTEEKLKGAHRTQEQRRSGRGEVPERPAPKAAEEGVRYADAVAAGKQAKGVQVVAVEEGLAMPGWTWVRGTGDVLKCSRLTDDTITEYQWRHDCVHNRVLLECVLK